jgi:serine O-acetyltransferase
MRWHRALGAALSDLVEELDAYCHRKRWPKAACVLMPVFYPQTWAIVHYRLNRWVFCHFRVPVLRQVVRAANFFVGRLITMLTGIEICERAQIGAGLYLAHMGTIIIAMTTKIGRNASIHQEVTFGGAGKGVEEGDFPEVGDDVYIGAGAKIIGRVKVGSRVLIGCNAVVIRDIPDHATAVGIPARVVNMKGSEGAVHVRPGRPHAVQ